MNAASALSFSAAVRKAAALSFVTLALAACGESPPPGGKWAIASPDGPIRCLNQSSGAPWDIVLDRAHALADGQPAHFDARHVTWTTVGSAYNLDAAAGVLTVGRGSSTGGWVSTFTCAPLRRS